MYTLHVRVVNPKRSVEKEQEVESLQNKLFRRFYKSIQEVHKCDDMQCTEMLALGILNDCQLSRQDFVPWGVR
jgi:hypothetical protein